MIRKYNKPYKIIQRKGRNIQVEFDHLPNKTFSTYTKDLSQALAFSDNFLKNGGIIKAKDNITFKEFTKDMFTAKDKYNYIKAKKAHGKIITEEQLKVYNRHINRYFNIAFGDYLISSINEFLLEDYLLNVKSVQNNKELSGNSKNKMLATLRIIFQLAYKQGYKKYNIADKVESFYEYTESYKDLTKQELQQLFPTNEQELLRIFLTKQWALYFLIMRDTGFRPGEVSALKVENYYPAFKGLYTQKSYNSVTGKVKDGIKTSNTGKKYKVGILTNQTITLLESYISNLSSNDSLFIINNNYINLATSNKHFKASLVRAGIQVNGRTQYSLRHSFETLMAGNVENKILLELMAHTSFRPEYDHRTPEQLLAQLQPVKDILETQLKN